MTMLCSKLRGLILSSDTDYFPLGTLQYQPETFGQTVTVFPLLPSAASQSCMSSQYHVKINRQTVLVVKYGGQADYN